MNEKLAASLVNTGDCTSGSLKFYNEQKEYGFIVLADGSEIFVHKADLSKHGIKTQHLAQYKHFYDIKLGFEVLEYQAKGKSNFKAVNISVTGLRPVF